MQNSLPFLTTDFPGVGGVIKARPEDFFVEELPLYEPSGSGTHIYAQIEKKGIGTREALDRIARVLNVSRRDIGLAGLKDAQAVARQWISVEHVSPEQVEQVSLREVRVLKTTRHTNKLKPGHLAGNRFVVRLRKLAMPVPQAAEVAQEVLSILSRRGVPNYFGPQRFGNHQDNHLLGKAVARNDMAAFADLLLGHPNAELDSPPIFQARTLYEQGRYEEAAKLWPGQLFDQRRSLRILASGKGNPKKVYYTVDKHLKGLFISAYQSDLFNRVLVARMPNIDKLLLGDMAYLHVNGACFHVEQPEVEQPRCDRFEISPTGPLLGGRTTKLTGPAGEIENPILDGENLNDDDFRQMKHLGARGGRRPLRFQPRNASMTSGKDDWGEYLEFRFELDSGCYATTLIAEITKDRIAVASEPEE
ncbi:MAG: tRNA pseudouridine(13) synthase TruD [Phycisphaerae bacterium]|nr:tRNA pseudouridine(13) synthase TruD [Phycisphaerae bacterium]